MEGLGERRAGVGEERWRGVKEGWAACLVARTMSHPAASERVALLNYTRYT